MKSLECEIGWIARQGLACSHKITGHEQAAASENLPHHQSDNAS